MISQNIVITVTCRSLWQHCRDEPSGKTSSSESFRFESKFTGNTNDEGRKDVK